MIKVTRGSRAYRHVFSSLFIHLSLYFVLSEQMPTLSTRVEEQFKAQRITKEHGVMILATPIEVLCPAAWIC
jgi:hypothetical protein